MLIWCDIGNKCSSYNDSVFVYYIGLTNINHNDATLIKVRIPTIGNNHCIYIYTRTYWTNFWLSVTTANIEDVRVITWPAALAVYRESNHITNVLSYLLSWTNTKNKMFKNLEMVVHYVFPFRNRVSYKCKLTIYGELISIWKTLQKKQVKEKRGNIYDL